MQHPKFRQDVQGLRGVAVLLVVIYHAELGWIKAGYLGVDIFFVISGFLIAGLIASQIADEAFSFREFYYRRAKRLLPSAYVVTGLTTLAAPFFLSDLALGDLAQQVMGALTFTANIVLWWQTGYFAETADTKPLLHFWSLAVEEQYYLILPALLCFVPRRRWKATLSGLLLASALLCAFMVMNHPSAAFYLMPTRFWEMAIGSVAALFGKHPAMASRLSSWRLPALAVLIIVPIFPTGLQHPGADAALVCLATAVLLVSPTLRMQTIRPWPSSATSLIRCTSSIGPSCFMRAPRGSSKRHPGPSTAPLPFRLCSLGCFSVSSKNRSGEERSRRGASSSGSPPRPS
jgi:peptidoglycan/LPS O-acetylase OafA/YrhL